ncbi:MAG: hypothetical protein ACYC35_24675 [Pirellulales bacterium]
MPRHPLSALSRRLCAALFLCVGLATAWSQAAAGTVLEIKTSGTDKAAAGLEPEVLDFRYAPPRWQTSICLPDDPHKSIVGSDGGLYYDYGGGAIEGFKTRVLARLEASGDRQKVRQSLRHPRIPIVETAEQVGKLLLTQHAWAAVSEPGPVDRWSAARVDYLRLRVKNTGQEPAEGRLVLQVDSPLALELNKDRTALIQPGASGKVFCGFSPACEPLEAAKPAAASGPRQYVLRFSSRKLAPGEETQVVAAFPRGKDATTGSLDKVDMTREEDRAVEYWRQVALPYDRICLPDAAMQGLLDGCIRNIYQARELRDGKPAFQVGPTCYRGLWAVDGSFITEAITYLGRVSEVRQGVELLASVNDEGPGGVAFSKKAGIHLWMMWRHAQLSGDWAWAAKMWPSVVAEVARIRQYRELTRKDPKAVNFGLMPVGFGDGGLGGEHREYTNVYWNLTGLQAACQMAEKLKKPELAAWKAEYADFWSAFDRARNRDKLVDAHGLTYVPVVMKGEQPQLPQRGAWAFLQAIFPGRIFDPADPLMQSTLAMLDANQQEGLIFGTGWLPEGVWNYAGSFYAHAHLWLGHPDKATATLYAFANHASPLLCWREEQSPVGKPFQLCGDMPHNWASAELIRLVRHLLIVERGEELHLLEGLPAAWTRPGNETKLVEVPTSFGETSVTLAIDAAGNSAKLVVVPPKREPPQKIVIHLERLGRPIEEVTLDGKKLAASAEIPTDRGFTVEVRMR